MVAGCGKTWADQPLGLAFDGLRETRSATCPAGAAIAGLRVHRGFQDWGDLDTYEFQLFCTTPPAGSGKPSSGNNGERGGSRKRSSGGRGGAPNRERAEADTVARPSGGGKSAFGSRAADAEAAAEEVRAEMRAASARRAAPQADEL